MRQAGMSMIEIIVTVAIAGVLLTLGLQSFTTMMATTRTKGAAESILSGLRVARSEAIRRNVPVRFQFVSDMTATCNYSTTSALWIVSQTDTITVAPTDARAHGRLRVGTTGSCNAQPYNPPDQPDPCNPDIPADGATGNRPLGNPATCSDDPWIVAKSSPGVNSTVVVSATSPIVTFGPLGQVLANIEATETPPIPSMTQVTVRSTNAEAKSWAVRVRAGSGTMKFCNPDLDPVADAANPMVC